MYSFPTFFELTTATEPENNSTVYVGTELRQNFVYFTVYKVYGKLVIDLFSYCIIIVLNSLIMRNTVRSTKLVRNWTKQGMKKATKNEVFGNNTKDSAEEIVNSPPVERQYTLEIPNDADYKMRIYLGNTKNMALYILK